MGASTLQTTAVMNTRAQALEYWNNLGDNPLLRIVEQGKLTTKYHGQMRKTSSLTGGEIEEIWKNELCLSAYGTDLKSTKKEDIEFIIKPENHRPKMNTLKNNKLIAEFLGAKACNGADYELYSILEFIEDGEFEQHFFPLEDMKFHTSWDWLMPVVERIETLENQHGFKYRVNIIGNCCTIESLNFSFVETISKECNINKRSSTYFAVVEFIEWYNQSLEIMNLAEIKSAIEKEITNYQDNPEYDNSEQQIKIFDALKSYGYYQDYDVQCVNIASGTKSGEEVFKFILENRFPELKETKLRHKVLTSQKALAKMNLVYIEMPSGFHIAIDANYLDRVHHFTLELPTGETLNTKLI